MNGSVVVSPTIPEPALALALVPEPTIQLDSGVVGLVLNIHPNDPLSGPATLPSTGGELVRLFHVSQMLKLERRVSPLLYIHEHRLDH